MSDPFCLSWPLHSRYLEGSTSQVYSSGFYFRISWILMEWLYFSQNQTLEFLKGLRRLQNWLTQKLSTYEKFWLAEMRRNDFVKNKVQPSIFMNLWSRNHLNKLDWLTPQDLYYIVSYLMGRLLCHNCWFYSNELAVWLVVHRPPREYLELSLQWRRWHLNVVVYYLLLCLGARFYELECTIM